MSILTVAQRGEAILNLIAAPVSEPEFSSQWLLSCVEALQDTMLARNGVGIAAPQVYISKRIIIVASRPNIRYPDAPEMEATVMVNPEIMHRSERMILGEEGCLSVAGERANVYRSETIQVKFFNVKGELKMQTFTGFPARIVQHEIDHLDGILFVDRMGM